MKVRVWNKEKEEYTTNFALIPLANELTAFPLETPEEMRKVQKLIRDNLSKLSSEDNFNIMPFYTSDYALIDFANYYGIQNYQIEYCSGKRSMDGRFFYENDVVKMSNVFDSFDNELVTIYGIVKLLDDGFYFYNYDGWCEPVGMKAHSTEIIGTIHNLYLEDYKGLKRGM